MSLSSRLPLRRSDTLVSRRILGLHPRFQAGSRYSQRGYQNVVRLSRSSTDQLVPLLTCHSRLTKCSGAFSLQALKTRGS